MKKKLKQANELLNQAVEVISFLEEIGGINNCGYNTEEDKKYVDDFFDKLKEYREKEKDTCPKCDQYPYSEKENNCPVCFDEIKQTKEL